MEPLTSVGLGRRILLVEDDPFLASMVKHVLTDQGFEVAVAHDAATGQEIAVEFDPDQALLDVMLGEGPSGVDLAHVLRATMPWVALVLVTNVRDLRAAGLPEPPPDTGIVNKNQVTDPQVLITAMKESLEGSQTPFITSQSPFGHLTHTQMTVLRMMAQGWSNEAIAAQRECSKSAVENRVYDVYRALDIGDDARINRRAEAVRIFVNAMGPVQRPQAASAMRDTDRFNALSSTQLQTLQLISQGYSNDAIARHRDISGSAVEKLISGIYRTLGLDADPDISRRCDVVRLYINTFGPMRRTDP